MDRVLEIDSKPLDVRKNPCREKLTTVELQSMSNDLGEIKFVIDGNEIFAHRCVLAAISPKYKTQFYGSMPETDTIIVEDVSPAAFKEFLQFFYEHDVVLMLEHIEEVINLAKQSLVDEIVTECMDFLMNVIGIDKLLWCYQLACVYELKPLYEFCVKQIGANIMSVFQSIEFLSCELGMLSHVLDADALNCNEIHVFDACILWANEKCKRDGNDAANIRDIREALGEAFFKIRFCSMTVEEFAAITINYSGLLTDQEQIDVFQTIALRGKGLKSSIFSDSNRKPRNSLLLAAESSKKPSLECSFGIGSQIDIDIPTMINDGIEFTCSKAIKLNGFIICNRIIHNFDVHVSLSDGQMAQSVRHLTSTLISDTETTVTFDHPIRVNANQWCYILLTSGIIKQFNATLRGFKALNSIKQNGIYFRFSEKNSKKSNLITRLLYHIVEESNFLW